MTQIVTSWGTKQNRIDGLSLLTEDEEKTLRQEWRTPPEFLAAMNPISYHLDAAASSENSVAPYFYSLDNGGLLNPWLSDAIRLVWCNPGFANMGAWIDKAITESHLFSHAHTIDVLGLCSPSAEWFGRAAQHATEILLLSPRVQFLPPDPRIVSSSNSRENALFRFTEKGGPALIRRARWAE